MNARSSEWLVEKFLGGVCLGSGAVIAAFLISRAAEGHFHHPITFIGLVAVAAFLCTAGMGLMEGKR